MKHFTTAVLFLLLTLQYAMVTAQVTTATLSGVVKDNTQKPLPSANVQVTYAEAGINKQIITKADGSFEIPNLRVGGPYTVTVTFTGFTPKTISDIILQLG